VVEDQIILPTIEEKPLDSSIPKEAPLNIPPSTTFEMETPKPNSPSPSISSTTPSDHTLPLSVENSEIPKIDNISSLSPEILKEHSKDEEKSETPQAEKVSENGVDQSTGTPILDNVAPMESQERE
ncbi:hypothetical protein A4A49_58792, partial [Nicotiana attenuata]